MITEVSTRKTRYLEETWTKWKDSYAGDMFYPEIYLWSEGNYSCDCNRAIFFWRAGPKDEPEPEIERCSNKDYWVEIRELDGTLVYADEEK